MTPYREALVARLEYELGIARADAERLADALTAVKKSITFETEQEAHESGWSLPITVVFKMRDALAAHRAAPPPEPAPKGEPAQAHAEALETVLAACKLQMVQHGNDANWGRGIKQEYIDAINEARVLLARLDAERKAQKGNMP